jgi:hypothetical protein
MMALCNILVFLLAPHTVFPNTSNGLFKEGKYIVRGFMGVTDIVLISIFQLPFIDQITILFNFALTASINYYLIKTHGIPELNYV